MNIIEIRFKNAGYTNPYVINDDEVAKATYGVLAQALTTGKPCQVGVDGVENTINGAELAGVSFVSSDVVKARQEEAEAERRAYESQSAAPRTAAGCGPMNNLSYTRGLLG